MHCLALGASAKDLSADSSVRVSSRPAAKASPELRLPVRPSRAERVGFPVRAAAATFALTPGRVHGTGVWRACGRG